MNCDICVEPFDHSIHKPHVLTTCGHTFCFTCLNHLIYANCPQCRKPYKDKNPNISLLRLIPESNYDRLKSDSLKLLVKIKKDLQIRDERLYLHETKLNSIKKLINKETRKIIDRVNLNSLKLTNECDELLNRIRKDFEMNLEEEAIQNNEFSESELTNLVTIYLPELKKKTSLIQKRFKNYENVYNFNLNKISHNDLIVGTLESSIGYKKQGNYLLNRKNYQDSMKYYDKAIEFHPTDPDAYYNKAKIFKCLNKYKESLECLNTGLKLNIEQDLDSAILVFDKYCDNLCKFYSKIFLTKSFLLLKLLRFSDFLKYSTAALELDPGNIKAIQTNKIIQENIF